MIDEDIKDANPKNDYHLYSVLYGHSSDVRDVTALMDDKFASCSRDGTIKIWERDADRNIYIEKKVLTEGHVNVNKMGVSCVHYIKPGVHEIFKNGCLVSGGYDKAICIWDIPAIIGTEMKPTYVLWGHTEAPTCLNVNKDGLLISGGSDNTGRIWKGKRVCQDYRGHMYPVWAIIGLKNGDIVTASGDKNAKIWKGEKLVKNCVHKDAVRGLAELPGQGFLSVANDGTITIWEYNGQLKKRFPAHEGFTYKIIVLSTGEWVTASEDTTVKIWKDENCIQTLVHPSGIWSVAELENGDLVTAGQDGGLRVWSKSPERIAPEDILNVHQKELEEKERERSFAALNMDTLSGPEKLSVPGTKDKERLYIKKDNVPYLYTWNMEKKEWECEGEIVGAKQGGEKAFSKKKYLGGQAYDYIFDIDLNGSYKKLTFNLGEDPYVAAQYCIEVNRLDQNYLDQIAKFIMDNVPNWKDVPAISFVRPEKNQKQGQQYGKNRYGQYNYGQNYGLSQNYGQSHQYGQIQSYGQSENYGQIQSYGQNYGGNFGGNYGQNFQNFNQGENFESGENPERNFEEDTSPSPMETEPKAPPSSNYSSFPQYKPVLFEDGKTDQILTKLKSFNDALAAVPATAALALNASSWSLVESAFKTVNQKSYYHSSNFSGKEYAAIEQVLHWPLDKIFPLLDFLRLMVLHPEAVKHWIETDFISKVIDLGSKKEGHAANLMLTFRFVANLFLQSSVRTNLLKYQEKLLETIVQSFPGANKQSRLVLATVLLNYSALYLTDPSEEGICQALSVLTEALKVSDNDEEVQFRLLVALGTMTYGFEEYKSLAKDLDVITTITPFKNSSSDRVKKCAEELFMVFG